jgi:RHS repeat-associated protein
MTCPFRFPISPPSHGHWHLTYNTVGQVLRRTGTTSYLHGGLKNQTRQTNSSQNTTATRTYDAFGNVTSSSGTWNGPFGNAGSFGYQEDATGLKLLGHRYYDSSLGRFITRDPIKDGRNWYAYCGNDPVNGSDPSGLAGPEKLDTKELQSLESALQLILKSRRKSIVDTIRRILKAKRLKKVKNLRVGGKPALGQTVTIKRGATLETFMYLEESILLSQIILAGLLVHEGTHAQEGWDDGLSNDDHEILAYEAEIEFYNWVISTYGKDSWQGQQATLARTIARQNQQRYKDNKKGKKGGSSSLIGPTKWGWMVR